MIGVMLVQIAFIYFGGEALRAMPLKFGDLIDIILVAFTVIIFDTVRKIFVRLFSISRKKSKQKFKIERKITNVK